MPAQTAWPERVLARYLTLVDATVDLTHENETSDGKKKATRAACTGCANSTIHTWSDSYPNHRRPGRTEFQNRAKGDRNARDWAQKHATACRALPKPPGPAKTPAAEPGLEPRRRLWLPVRRKTA
ncbi:hypothetical protein OHR86_28095 [Streptomyces sp. NBC_00441]|uniref:hypothetical protein n=1 Tax=Streptomyces sp. NBC_00441 TaxID=2975742 RepID=UPI002E2C4651|nr:hypothetical protein [Streptomyces sp. NBC_00441]